MDAQQINEALQKGIRAARSGRAEPARHFLTQVIQADPGNEEAWLWLARVAGNPGQQAECLQKVLQINPNNRWAAEQLARLQAAPSTAPPPISAAGTTPPPPPAEAVARESGKDKPPQPKGSELKLEALKCPQCGGSVDIQGRADVRTVVCRYCGSILNLTEQQAAVIGQANQRIRPLMPIELGMEAKFNNETHQVIGWLRYEGWDDEDRWRWDEWLLASASGKYLWLSYDREEGFILNKKIKPLVPFSPQTATSIQVPGGTAHVTERASAKVIALKGELTWQANIGERVGYFDAKAGSTPYSVEYTKDEIELYEGQPLSDVEVWTAFGQEDRVKKATETAQWNTAYKVIALFCVILTFFSCIGIVFAGLTGEELFEEQIQMSQGTAVQTVGPINITEPGRVHRINLNAGGLPVNTWAVVDVTARDTSDNEYFLFSGEFWDEEGTDSDGHWHENDLNASYLFKLEDPGEYYLDLTMEEATVSSVPVTVTLERGVWLSRYFIIFLIIGVVLAFVFFSMGQRRLMGSSLITSK
ncbi:MAG: DUF4178 domain-containing protein [Anaerolineae bacterium]|nr:DUF4178 domain-containing protein [Anaerolineae bacterium]